MAEVEYSGLVNYISGKLGDQIYSRNQGGNYIKMAADAVWHRDTARQLQVKENFCVISKLWNKLPRKYQAIWNDHATAQNKKYFGHSLFRSYNCNLLNASHSMLSTISYPPPHHKNPKFPKNVIVTKIDDSTICIVWNKPSDPCVFITGNYKLHSGFCGRHPEYGCCPYRGHGSHWRFIETKQSNSNKIVLNHIWPTDTLMHFRIRSIDHYGRKSPWTGKIRLIN